jgi:hypothetical protein
VSCEPQLDAMHEEQAALVVALEPALHVDPGLVVLLLQPKASVAAVTKVEKAMAIDFMGWGAGVTSE